LAQLQEYLDGRLSPSGARAVAAHLAVCAACRARLASLRHVDEALATWPLLEEPVDFTARVMAQVRAAGAGPAPATLPAFRLRWEDAVASLAFAGGMAALLLVFSLLPPQYVLAARAWLERSWWTLLPELDRLWHAARLEPVYAVWGLSSLGVAAAAAGSAVALLRLWQRRPVVLIDSQHEIGYTDRECW